MSEWVLTAERLPEDEETVLVYDPTFTREPEPVFLALFADGVFWPGDNRRIRPSHWMPKPAPPVERSDHEHQWGIDGAHSNRFCKVCFVSHPDEARKHPDSMEHLRPENRQRRAR